METYYIFLATNAHLLMDNSTNTDTLFLSIFMRSREKIEFKNRGPSLHNSRKPKINHSFIIYIANKYP